MNLYLLYERQKAVFWSIYMFILITMLDIVVNRTYWYTFYINYEAGSLTTFFDPNYFIDVFVLFLFVIFIPTLTLGITLMTNDKRAIILFPLLCYGGSKDVIWFWMQKLGVPYALPWLWGGVSGLVVHIAASISLIIFVLVARSKTVPVIQIRHRFDMLLMEAVK